MENKDKSKYLFLTVIDREKKVFEGEVLAISTYNLKGIFDVLPYHENFISIIKTSLIIHATNHEKKEIKLDRGVMQVFDNHVEAYLGI